MDRIEEYLKHSLMGRQIHSHYYTSVPINSYYAKFLSFPVSTTQKFEIPLPLIDYIKLDTDYDYTIVLPITAAPIFSVKKTAKGAFACFTDPAYYTRGFSACEVADGTRYYGCPSMILNAQKNPLLVFTAEVSKGKDNIHLDVHRIICHVSPKVFTCPEKIIEKNIIKKIIPYCSTSNPLLHFDALRLVCKVPVNMSNLANTTIKVVIDTCDNMTCAPVIPKVSLDINEELNAFLCHNVDKIINKLVIR